MIVRSKLFPAKMVCFRTWMSSIGCEPKQLLGMPTGIRLGEHYLESSAGHVLQMPSNDCDMPKKINNLHKKTQVWVGQRTQKQDWHTVTQHPFFKKILWWRQLCSARNRRKIFIETSCALMVSGATIHHSMLRQLTIAADVII